MAPHTAMNSHSNACRLADVGPLGCREDCQVEQPGQTNESIQSEKEDIGLSPTGSAAC
jgi:hypothetical protein